MELERITQRASVAAEEPRTFACVSAREHVCVLVRSRSLTLDRMLIGTALLLVTGIACFVMACLCLHKACHRAALAQARALRDSDERHVPFRSSELALLLKN
eukprot:5160047-Prymnesium_polylepis.1